MYWITEPPMTGYAEREDGTFVMAFQVFSSKQAAAEYARHSEGGVRRTREVGGDELADMLEGLSVEGVVVNPLPYTPYGAMPEDVRTVEEFLEGLRGA